MGLSCNRPVRSLFGKMGFEVEKEVGGGGILVELSDLVAFLVD